MVVFDARPVLTRAEAVAVYDSFALKGHLGGKDASSGYGGPAITALLTMGAFAGAKTVVDYGCGQGKLAELLLTKHPHLSWRGYDQSPEMCLRATERCHEFGARAAVERLDSGDPIAIAATTPARSVDRFVSTYCLDLLSEQDLYDVLAAAQRALNPERGILLLAGITWGYRLSLKTFFMTLLWELLYRFTRKTVGGCRPQKLEQYLLSKGWIIVKSEVTMPVGFPWMASEVIAARPPP